MNSIARQSLTWGITSTACIALLLVSIFARWVVFSVESTLGTAPPVHSASVMAQEKLTAGPAISFSHAPSATVAQPPSRSSASITPTKAQDAPSADTPSEILPAAPSYNKKEWHHPPSSHAQAASAERQDPFHAVNMPSTPPRSALRTLLQASEPPPHVRTEDSVTTITPPPVAPADAPANHPQTDPPAQPNSPVSAYPPIHQPSITSGTLWLAHAGSYQSSAAAFAERERLTASGFTAEVIVLYDSRHIPWFCLLAGMGSKQAQAEQICTRFTQRENTTCTPRPFAASLFTRRAQQARRAPLPPR